MCRLKEHCLKLRAVHHSRLQHLVDCILALSLDQHREATFEFSQEKNDASVASPSFANDEETPPEQLVDYKVD